MAKRDNLVKKKNQNRFTHKSTCHVCIWLKRYWLKSLDTPIIQLNMAISGESGLIPHPSCWSHPSCPPTQYFHFDNGPASLFIYSSFQRYQSDQSSRYADMGQISPGLFWSGHSTLLHILVFWKAWQLKLHATKGKLSTRVLEIPEPCSHMCSYMTTPIFFTVIPIRTYHFRCQFVFEVT